MRRIVDVRVLPGEPTDGGGRTCIHLFVRDPAGPFVEPHVLHPVLGPDGKQRGRELEARPTRGRLACDPRRQVAPRVCRGVTYLTLRTDQPGAVTCPKCRETAAFRELASVAESGVPGSGGS